MDNITSLRFFWPESVLTVAVIAMLIQDLFVRRSARRVAWLTAGALFWLALTALATWMTPWGDFPLFGGLIQHDPLRFGGVCGPEHADSIRLESGGSPPYPRVVRHRPEATAD